MAINWAKRFIFGYKRIDVQHKRFFKLVSSIEAVVTKGKDLDNQEVIDKIFKRLDEFMLLHFNEEESLMGCLTKQERESHISEHYNIRKRIKKEQEYANKNGKISLKLLSLLEDWEKNHLLDFDKILIDKYTKKQKFDNGNWFIKIKILLGV